MPKLKPGIIWPTPEEDAAITAAAMSDPDALPYTDEEWEQVKPYLQRGRPKAKVTKDRITIRLSREVTEFFRNTGAGWQTRMDEVLREYVASHRNGLTNS